ncbi:unnamed protein product [[Actinomadura] parvosata subsp. kistnae]|uniref:hypothetical protein n=1 Tax=[Actinomadura] parvosata TaxID=1955412 RepID=UPI000D2AF8FE|nr:unnamed protein product [Actinomadura parvosata subsp. kistnae]
MYLVNAADEVGVHVFPHSTFEWRAAEHSLDPDDVDTLLDVILHEVAMPSRDDALVHDDPGALAVLRETYNLPGCSHRESPMRRAVRRASRVSPR